MTENLSEMVKDDQPAAPVMFEETDLDLPTDETEAAAEPETGEIPPAVEAIAIMPLSVWFEREAEKFEGDTSFARKV